MASAGNREDEDPARDASDSSEAFPALSQNELVCAECNNGSPRLHQPCPRHVYHFECLTRVCVRQQNIRCLRCRRNYRNVTAVHQDITQLILEFIACKVVWSVFFSYLGLSYVNSFVAQLGVSNALNILGFAAISPVFRPYIPNIPNPNPLVIPLDHIRVTMDPVVESDGEESDLNSHLFGFDGIYRNENPDQ